MPQGCCLIGPGAGSAAEALISAFCGTLTAAAWRESLLDKGLYTPLPKDASNLFSLFRKEKTGRSVFKAGSP